MKRNDVIKKVVQNVKEQLIALQCDSLIKTITDLHAAINFDHLHLTDEETNLLGDNYLEDILDDLSRFKSFCSNNDIDYSQWK